MLDQFKGMGYRKNSVHQIIEELEAKTKNLGAVIEYFEPPAVPGYGAAGGISLRMLDKTGGGDYKRFDEINQEFMNKLKARKELTGVFTFFSANFPQYSLKLDRKVAVQKGINIGKCLK